MTVKHSTPKIDDYGGNRYGRRYRTQRSDPRISSFRCDSCGRVRYVTARELARAAKPRCLNCGGLLLETAAEEKRHQEARKPIARQTGYRCSACGVLLGKFQPRSLVAHLVACRDCLKHYARSFIVPCGAMFGTLYVERCKPTRWLVYGMMPDGAVSQVYAARTAWAAKEWITQQDDDRRTSDDTRPAALVDDAEQPMPAADDAPAIADPQEDAQEENTALDDNGLRAVSILVDGVPLRVNDVASVSRKIYRVNPQIRGLFIGDVAEVCIISDSVPVRAVMWDGMRGFNFRGDMRIGHRNEWRYRLQYLLHLNDGRELCVAYDIPPNYSGDESREPPLILRM